VKKPPIIIEIVARAGSKQTKSTHDETRKTHFAAAIARGLAGGVFTFHQIEFWLRQAGAAKASNSREYGIKLKAIFASAKRAAHRTELLCFAKETF
jgi:hypothetical protein